jgi:hypothetical protein
MNERVPLPNPKYLVTAGDIGMRVYTVYQMTAYGRDIEESLTSENERLKAEVAFLSALNKAAK